MARRTRHRLDFTESRHGDQNRACHRQGGSAAGQADNRGYWLLSAARKTLKLPRYVWRGGMRAFGSGLDARGKMQVEGRQWWRILRRTPHAVYDTLYPLVSWPPPYRRDV